MPHEQQVAAQLGGEQRLARECAQELIERGEELEERRRLAGRRADPAHQIAARRLPLTAAHLARTKLTVRVHAVEEPAQRGRVGQEPVDDAMVAIV